MSGEVKVSVCSWGPGRSLTLRWRDEVSGKQKTRSAKTADWRTAERLAGELETELAAGTVSPSRVTWDEFVAKYTAEKLDTLAAGTKEAALASLRHVKRILSIEYLSKLTAAAVSQFSAQLRQEGMRDTTLAHHLRHVKAASRWAAKLGYMSKAPAIEMPKRAKGQTLARSRAVSAEEFDRMLAAVGQVRTGDAAEWRRFLTGLWLSGLRRSEALRLTWDGDGDFCVCLSEKRPVFVIRASGQKSGKAETCPMAPDFVAWLLAEFPPTARTGNVFNLIDMRTNQPISSHRVGQVVERIGRKALVKVGTTTKTKDGKAVEVPSFAGCHSLRRGFGSRWARNVSPSVLKRLMRHNSIATTEGFYVHMDAADVGDELWKRFGPQEVTKGAGLQQTVNTPPGGGPDSTVAGIDVTPDNEKAIDRFAPVAQSDRARDF